MSKVIGVIPARLSSTRFPGKVLAPIGGKPLVQWVVERVRQAKRLDDVIVATDSAVVQHFCDDQQIRCVMTRDDHQSGTDRVAEVAGTQEADFLLNIQGDEPLICPDLIDELVARLVDPDSPWDMVTAATPLRELRELEDPSVVKVVLDRNGAALYFSRAPIPHFRDLVPSDALEVGLHYRHLGIYGFCRHFLDRFVAAPASPLEKAEKLEQLRALHIGGRIHVSLTDVTGPGVDHPEDVARAETALQDAGLLP